MNYDYEKQTEHALLIRLIFLLCCMCGVFSMFRSQKECLAQVIWVHLSALRSQLKLQVAMRGKSVAVLVTSQCRKVSSVAGLYGKISMFERVCDRTNEMQLHISKEKVFVNYENYYLCSSERVVTLRNRIEKQGILHQPKLHWHECYAFSCHL